jgi:heme/copper-type cytochrome/quinol oxidase subunit 4
MYVADRTLQCILGAFRKLWKIAVSSFVMSVCLSVTSVCLCNSSLLLHRFSLNFVLGSSKKKSVSKIEVWLKLDKNSRHLAWRPAYTLTAVVTKITSVCCLLWLCACTWNVVVCLTCEADWCGHFPNVCVCVLLSCDWVPVVGLCP